MYWVTAKTIPILKETVPLLYMLLLNSGKLYFFFSKMYLKIFTCARRLPNQTCVECCMIIYTRTVYTVKKIKLKVNCDICTSFLDDHFKHTFELMNAKDQNDVLIKPS